MNTAAAIAILDDYINTRVTLRQFAIKKVRLVFERLIDDAALLKVIETEIRSTEHGKKIIRLVYEYLFSCDEDDYM